MLITNIFFKIISKFISYLGFTKGFSLDGEDTILDKYFSNFHKGNYIDIGSNEPIKHSNTFSLYLKGWKGICIDPIPSLKKKYKLLRPKDIFINCGITEKIENKRKDLRFFYYKDFPDNSTFDTQRVANLEKMFNRKPSSIIQIPLISLNKLFTISNEFFKINNNIHFLNLDIEGMEELICEGFFNDEVFPWVICVEQLGYTVENIKSSSLYKMMRDNNYFLASKTFLSSIYIKKDKLSSLHSPYIKEIINNFC